LEDVPSLQVTIGFAPFAGAGAAVFAGSPPAVSPPVAMPPWPRQAPRPPLDDVPSLQVTIGFSLFLDAGAAAVADSAAGAFFCMPP
jgi:hypothetical protein